MEKIWIKNDDGQMNIKVDFVFETTVKGEIGIKVAAADVFRLSVNDKVIGYGPRRIGKGVSALNEYSITCTSDLTVIKIEVVSYKNDGYYIPIQNAFFAAEVICGGQVLAASSAFTAYRDYGKEQKVLRYSLQRNFTESYRYPSDYVKQEVCEVNGNEICDCDLPYPDFSFSEGREIERGSIKIKEKYDKFPLPFVFPLAKYMLQFKEYELESDVVDDLSAIEYYRDDAIDVSENYYRTFEFDYAMTGFISVEVEVESAADIYFVFDETMNTELFRFSEKIYADYYHNSALPVYWHRLNTVNIVKYALKSGKCRLLTIEPYCLKFLRIIVVGKATVSNVRIVKYENADAFQNKPDFKDKVLNELYVAAQRTFAQCSVDWLIDCPSRERAAWLCDTYFSAKAERYLTGSNRIEKNTLNAFLTLPKEDYSIPEKMIPMCLYVNPFQKLYMPTWAMWFVMEIDDYLSRTGDKEFTDKFREKIYGLIEWFNGYVNEYGLLEDVDGQLFIEWSKANDFTAGVYFPAFMLFYKTLYAVYNL
ncbi:MAG: hypothetical protein J6Y43_03625, partial [Clostridia bacterium]|nr:hypothetical protein [Clostridia bacterium]